MALRPDQFPATLEKGLAPVYLLGGAEPLLIQECRDQVIHAAQSAGFTERSVHEVHVGFDWDELSEESAAPSLFSSQKILDIRLPSWSRATCWPRNRRSKSCCWPGLRAA